MLENSKDLLNIAIAISVFMVAAFGSWAIYYFAMIMRQGFKIVKEMRDRLQKIDDLMHSLKDKIEHSTSYLLLIGEGIKKLVDIVDKRTAKKEGKKEEED